MFCPKCGMQNADGVSFCQNCGMPLTTGQPVYQQTMYSQRSVSSTGLAVMKKVCSSPVALIAIIAYTAAAVFNFLSSISGSSGIFKYLYQIADMLDMEDMIFDFYYAVRGTSVVSAVIGMIPTVLIAVGLWLTYTYAVSRNHVGMKTGGLTLVKVILIINIVFICIALAAFEIIVLMAVVNFANSYFGSSMVGPLVGVMIGVAVVIALVILFCVKAVKSINTIKLTAQTGIPSDKVSIYVAVMAFIMGSFTALSIIGSHSVFVLLANLCSATASITFGVFLFSYRGKMRSTTNGSGYINAQQPTYVPSMPSYSVPGAPTSQNTSYNQPMGAGQDTTVLGSNAPQQLITCSKCGGQYGMLQGQKCRCPYCGNIEGE